MSDAIPLLPMKEALDFWGKKVPMKAADFYKLGEEYRVRAFAVGKIAQLDMVAHVQKSIEGALHQGTPMTQWRKNATDFFKRAGWTGNTRYRLDTIFRNNVQAAYGAGRWARAQESEKDRPLAMYDAIDDGRGRPTHAAQDGKVYPLSHPYWTTWWPPNGHRCRCSVRTLSRDEAKDMGLKVETDIDGVPDEGFQTNPGHTPALARFVSQKLDGYTPALRQQFLDEAADYPFQIMSRYLGARDIESMQTLLRAQQSGGVGGYEEWVDAVRKKRKAGRVYPIGNIPPHIASQLKNPTPSLSLALIRDRDLLRLFRDTKKDRRATLTAEEAKSIPKRFRDKTTEWYEDQERPGTIIAWARMGSKRWLKVVFRVNGKAGKMRANVVRSAGVVDRKNINEDRYKKIARLPFVGRKKTSS